MTENIYQLIPVANGFIVMLPYKQRTQWDGLAEVALNIKANESGMPSITAPPPTTDERTFIFSSLTEAISFLKLKIEGEV